ncbi:unnamed protein product [Candidula unifasciata]|uniref:Hermansky-Pudlak syndrome 3 protein n=1 Tax=Candidula unifasciata TaxID=100452 RepID=A0A8S3YUJ1_9EUPU|nr:unnamed protein product [Candidula unifasciata]
MVRVFKYHSFSSQRVIPIETEPLTVCADHDKVFVATSDCEIIVFEVREQNLVETQRCPTISLVETIVYNAFRSYIVTVELKKSWMRLTKSVRVYLNWETSVPGAGKPRTKVRIAGKSHVQHVSSTVRGEMMEIVEVPLDENATSVAVCRSTGNFAVACGSEVKLCSVVEKMIGNSDKTYLDVEVFLELCWNFEVKSVSLCEEFIICCSLKEVQGIRVRYDEREKRLPKKVPVSSSHSTRLQEVGNSSQDLTDSYKHSSDTDFSQSHHSEYLFPNQWQENRSMTISSQNQPANSEFKTLYRTDSDVKIAKDFSVVGMRPSQHSSQYDNPHEATENNIVDDENFLEWNFQQGEASVCLPSLHSGGSTDYLCYHHAHAISPPVLSDFSNGKGKAISGVQAETVLYLNDPQEKEEWKCVILIPTYNSALETLSHLPSLGTDKMRSVLSAHRTSMCCYISGTRGGYLYQLSPLLQQVSSYKYTDKALQVGVSQSFLHVVTCTGIETYTSRWGAVALEMQEKEDIETADGRQTHPPSNLDICLCGHEPFLGAVDLSVGADFLTLLSKVEDPSGSEVHWGVYVLHSFSLLDLYRDMIAWADRIKITGPASYIHILQEAHLLLTTNSMFNVSKDSEIRECYREVCRRLGEYYSQPGQDDWGLCWPYYSNSGASVQELVQRAQEQAEQTKPQEFGKGLIDYLDNVLFAQDKAVNLSTQVSNVVLNIYAVSAPEKISQVILLSNMKSFSTEESLNSLSSWLSNKARSSQPISAVDKLAMVQLHLTRCEVDEAITELKSIKKSSLVNLCSSHPEIIHDNLASFKPLAQLMRQHTSSILLEVLVEMLDSCSISLGSLLTLLQSQSDLSSNNHIRESLELILSDEKRALLFDEAAQMLCEIYIAKLKENSQLSAKQISALAHQKFSLPLGNGHFAPRFAWLDYLPPFQGPNKMARPCQRLEVKHIPGPGSRNVSLPVTMVTKHAHKERCQCFVCNESLLKLQSLLCSPHLTSKLASFVMHHIEEFQTNNLDEVKDADMECWDSVRYLCLTKLNLEKATEEIVDRYPSIIGMFSASCFSGHVDKYSHLLRTMEAAMKLCKVAPNAQGEETYVRAYKDLLSRMAELFPPATFLELLPADGNLYFLLPYLCTNLKLDHTERLKQTIVSMGKDILSHN